MTWLDELEALERAAMSGPWRYHVEEPLPDRLDDVNWKIRSDAVARTVCGRQLPPIDADADLLVALRNAAPALLRIALGARELLEFMDRQWPPDAVAFGRRDDLREALDALEGGETP